MKRALVAALRGLATALLFLAAGLCFAPTAVMPFLDRIYYRGPASDHYDGGRFVNPDGPAPLSQGRRRGFFQRMVTSDERARWPDHVTVTPSVPPPRVGGEEMRVTWVGHSTVLVQTAGLNILTDPIWSERASPFSFAGPRRVRAPGVRFEDLPKIDIVLLSHNHYDHLDLPTLRRLWQRDAPSIVTSLGNGTILRNGGIGSRLIDSEFTPPDDSIYVLDWGGSISAMPDFCVEGSEGCTAWTVEVVRNHHWSSRWFTDRNRALWSAFVVRTPAGNIFFAGDTGWGDGSWVREAARRGPYRLALLPIGAYEPRDFMRTHHIDPAEAVAIFEALDPTMALGIHWGTFQLTFEPIDEPWQRLAALRRQRGIGPNRFVALEAGRSFSVPPAR